MTLISHRYTSMCCRCVYFFMHAHDSIIFFNCYAMASCCFSVLLIFIFILHRYMRVLLLMILITVMCNFFREIKKNHCCPMPCASEQMEFSRHVNYFIFGYCKPLLKNVLVFVVSLKL